MKQNSLRLLVAQYRAEARRLGERLGLNRRGIMAAASAELDIWCESHDDDLPQRGRPRVALALYTLLSPDCARDDGAIVTLDHEIELLRQYVQRRG